MKASPYNPRHLDVEHFATETASVQGRWALSSLPRLQELQVAGAASRADGDSEITFSAHGELLANPGGAPGIALRLQAQATVTLVCQRCLQALALKVGIDQRYRFVDDEETAAGLDADSDDDDFLALTPSLDLCVLVEDELLMALPIVPRHDDCEIPAGADTGSGEGQEAVDGDAPNPFAVLAGLKSRKRP
jgi:uncharacterized protein